MFSKFWDLTGRFAPGRVPLLLLLFGLVSGAAVAVRSSLTDRPVTEIWTFTHLSWEEFNARLAEHPDHERIKLSNLGRAMCDRLALAVMTQTELPDLVEVEQSELGRFLRGPVERMPFVDLTERIQREGWDTKCVAARFARYSVQGRIFGIPHDLHPVVMVYRPEVLSSAGYSPQELTTWDDWVRAAAAFHRPGEMGTTDWRYGLALSTIEGFDYLILLWQRGGDVFDAKGQVVLDDELAVETLEFYVSLLHSDPPAAGPRLSSSAEDFAALARGQFATIFAPDWLLASMQLEAESLLSGKVRCMAMPVWRPGGRRTGTVGGTMMGIPVGCPDVDRAWELAKFLYFDREALVARFRNQTIVPPVRAAYDDPIFDREIPFFQGQRVGRLLTSLAEEVPPVNGSAYMPEAYALLNAVFADVMAGRVSPREALT
ncbi:MAG: extracellular solute-binding protein, partial [bacterium]|nr:extracellular solute-binding protein [bacterium]